MTELLIENCSNLVSFPEVCFLPNLSKLEIRNCNALTSLPKGIVCNSLTGQLPSYLKRLEIGSCEKLEYLWDDKEESCTSVVDEENSNNTTRMNLTISIRTNKYKNRHLSMLHFTRKVLPCPVVYFPSCNSFCMHEESKDKEIMNPPLRAFKAVFSLC
ncbi:hypothetical protein LWI29_017949 [Acer saccharum]|uniref:Uncharacterized protein n=1 Tax=Acer saccharum TaxID=4024 RepID=A0AA39T449_ACESA|nr:hypothetical protein LWI29_017949 [Acer saccharum]